MKAAKIITKVIKELYKPDGITICQNDGKFDTLTHFHMYVVPRYQEKFGRFFAEEPEQVVVDNSSLSKTRNKIIAGINNLELV